MFHVILDQIFDDYVFVGIIFVKENIFVILYLRISRLLRLLCFIDIYWYIDIEKWTVLFIS